MKHLIALSMKYIRRQKLRTFLTFMCITLSAFILATVCAYGSSIFTTLLNNEIRDNGKWELEISNWTDKTDNPGKSVKFVKQHPVVEDYLYISGESTLPPKGNSVNFFELTDGKTTHRLASLSSETYDGNLELTGDYEDTSLAKGREKGIFVSNIFKDMGYKEGDVIRFRLRPARAEYDENAQVIKDIRAELKEKYGTEYTIYDKEYENLPEDLQKSACKTGISTLLHRKKLNLESSPLVNITYGAPVTYTFQITGFKNIERNPSEKFLDIISTSDETISFSELYEKNPEINYEADDHELRIRIADNIDFDDAVKQLFIDLGFDYDRDFYNKEDFGISSNTFLLALEWKSSDAIAKVIPGFVVPALILLLIAWFIARFVIDNAFEMAAQERSTHFAALRIMGASKLQLATVVLAEAIFYIFTAIPLGIISALLICRSLMNSFNSLSSGIFEFSAKPLFLGLAIFLSVIAVLISAYTSAMWGARKLSPAEALNFGKPRSNKKKQRKSKSKLDLSSKKFLKRYTRKNIRASKSRFIVATITMGLGVLMFVFSGLMGLCTLRDMRKELNHDNITDFWIDEYLCDDPKETLDVINKTFGNKEIFNRVDVNTYTMMEVNLPEDSDPMLRKGMSNGFNSDFKSIAIQTIDRSEYEKFELEKIIGMSYDDLLAIKGSFRNTISKTEKKFVTPQKESYYEFYGVDEKIKLVGESTSKLQKTGLIIPIETTLNFNIPYNITLTTNKEHYEEAVKIFDDFVQNNNTMYSMNAYMVGTGLIDFISSIVKLVLTFLVSIWLVGILSMVNSVNTSVLNRSRELMMLRSVGMTRQQLRKSVILETLLFSSTSAIMGTILGVAVFILVWNDRISKVIIPVIIVVILSIILNILIAIVSAIPAIKSLGKVESIAQAVNR